MDKIIKNALVDGKLTDVTVRNGKIIKVGKTDCEGEITDLHGKELRAGLFDIHSHGNSGYDTMDNDRDALRIMSEFELRCGVTSWLPTTMTMPMSEIIRATAEIPEKCDGRANIVGFHMEGPFISPLHNGAQRMEDIILPSADAMRSVKNIKMLTLAPELDGADKVIEYCRENGIAVSIGHTDADYETSARAIRMGAKCLTHTFNAMPPLHHRETGPIGAAITEDAYVQVICDGKHIHRAAILALYRIFGAERMILISDSMRATGLGDGDFIFGGQKVTVRDCTARTEDGALAGSTSTLFDCIMTAISFGIPADDAYRMASETPAKLMGLKKGKIAEGYDAEFIVPGEDGKLESAFIL